MAAFSDYVESGLINHLLRTGTFAKPPNISIALCSNVPVDASTGANCSELPNSNGYARFNMGAPADASWAAPGASGYTYNLSQLTFNQATADWGYVSGVAIVDSGVYGAGNVLMYGALTTPRQVLNGDQFKFNVADIQWTLA